MSENKTSDKQERPRTNALLRRREGVTYAQLIDHAEDLERELAIAKDDLEVQCRAWWEAASPYATPKALREALSATLPSAEAVRIAREFVDNAADFEPSKAKAREVGLSLVATLMDEHMLLCREIIRLARFPAQGLVIDPQFLECVNDSRYSNEWVGIAFRNLLATETLYVGEKK